MQKSGDERDSESNLDHTDFRQYSSSSYSGCTQENLSVSVSTRNQLNVTGFTYDSAGNLVSAPPTGTSYAFDAENHLVSAAGQTYVYDGDGKRVEKASGSPLTAKKLYWYDQGGNVIYETDPAGNELYRYFRFQGLLVTREEANDWVDHYGLDHLGNVRWLYATNGGSPGTPGWDISDYYPFGGERIIQSYSNNNRKFTSKERDSESGNDNFGARFYSSSLGRFISPDWSDAPEPLPYADLTNPQTLNLYSYVKNNPLRDTDPTGHSGDDDSISKMIQDAVLTAIGTWASDNLFGALRPNPDTLSGKMGQAFGDFAAQQSGIVEDEYAATLTPGALALAGAGQVEVLAVPAGLALHGTATATLATVNLAKDAEQTSSGGPKAEDAPGVTSGGQATDKYGNKLGPSRRTQVNQVDHSTVKGAKDAARAEGKRAPVKHPSPKKGKSHFHPTDQKGEKIPCSTHHNCPK